MVGRKPAGEVEGTARSRVMAGTMVRDSDEAQEEQDMSSFYLINPRGPDTPYVFGPDFFKRKFPEFMQKACDVSGKTAVLEILLTSGQTLDVAYVDEIEDDYMLLAVFADSRDCSETYNTYVRYDAVYQVNVLHRDSRDRSLGFNIRHKPRVATEAIGFKPPLKGSSLDGSDTKDKPAKKSEKTQPKPAKDE